MSKNIKHEIRTAILVDGGFYRQRARYLFGAKPPKERADELNTYCLKHLNDKFENRYLYGSSGVKVGEKHPLPQCLC